MKSASFQKFQIAAILFLMIFTACGKKNPVSEITKTVLITASTWKYDNAGVDINGDGTSDSPLPPTVLLPCTTDNLITFKSDKSGVVDEGPTKCPPGTDPQTTPFNWELTNNETEMTFSTAIFTGLDGSVKILELTATKFRFSKQVTLPVGSIPIPLPVTVVVSLKH